jgi:hypothetical protein
MHRSPKALRGKSVKKASSFLEARHKEESVRRRTLGVRRHPRFTFIISRYAFMLAS